MAQQREVEALQKLSALAAEIEEMSANTSAPLSATKAYQDIFLARLTRLNMADRPSGSVRLSGQADDASVKNLRCL